MYNPLRPYHQTASNLFNINAVPDRRLKRTEPNKYVLCCHVILQIHQIKLLCFLV